MKKPFKKGLLFGLTFLLTVVFGIIGYAAWTNINPVVGTDNLTAALWNNLVTKVNDIGNRTENVYTGSLILKNVPTTNSRIEMRGGLDGGSSSSIYMYNGSNQLNTSISDGTYSTYFNSIAGNLSIGNNNPQSKLSVYKNIIGGNTSVANSHIYIRGNDNGYGLSLGVLNSPAGPFLQSKLNDVSSASLPLFINPDGGNVSIGSTSAWGKLSIGGFNNGDGLNFYSPADDALGIQTNLNTYNWGTYGAGILALQPVEGNVGIGTAAPGYKLTVNGQPAANGYTAFTNYSDRRLKENISKVSDGVLDKIMELNPVNFMYNDKYFEITGYDKKTKEKKYKGFIAQELEKVFPEMVHSKTIKGEEYLDTDLSSLQIYMLKAMQEQQKIIENQQKQINELKNIIENK